MRLTCGKQRLNNIALCHVYTVTYVNTLWILSMSINHLKELTQDSCTIISIAINLIAMEIIVQLSLNKSSELVVNIRIARKFIIISRNKLQF